MKKKLFAVFVLAGTLALTGCGAGGYYDSSYNWGYGNSGASEDGMDENFRYESVIEQGFYDTADAPASYFSLDRNTASYSQVRAQLNMGSSVSPDSVRIEEMINYFTYDYPSPEEGEIMRATAYLSDCPWETNHRLLTVGLKTEEKVITTARNNYVFLIDVSGSMSGRVYGLEGTTCLDLVKYGIEKLVEGLGENDSVSIATYAGSAGKTLDPTYCTEKGKETIMKAVNKLTAYGSTNGSGGLEVAYQLATEHFSEDGNNRVILMSDGDFNVGLRNGTALTEFIQEKAQSGVYLSVLGFGMGNMRDDFMQTLAMNGNGNYAYIDTPREAEKVLGEELGGMLTAVAKDAKAGVTFNEETVTKYRLIGYDMKMMSEDDFNNSEKDAGEIGSNLCVTALYEVELAEGAEEGALLADVEVRFKSVLEDEEERSATAQAVNTLTYENDLAFIACVAEFGLVLRQSEYRGEASLTAVRSRLADLVAYLEEDVYKEEFQSLVETAIASNRYA